MIDRQDIDSRFHLVESMLMRYYYRRVKIWNQGDNDIGVVIATK